MSMSAKVLSEVSVKVGVLKTSEYPIKIHGEIKIGSNNMYTLTEGTYKFGVQVGGVVIPTFSESQALLIAEKMAGLILNVALEARKS